MARSTGFSLVELLVVLAVMSILATSGLSFLDAINRYRFLNSVNAQLGMLAFARNAAASRYVSVSLCPSDTGITCGQQWAKGMLAFEDRNGDAVLGEEDKILNFQAHDTQVGRVNWSSFTGRNAVIFNAKGLTPASNGTFLICDQQGRLARNVIINRGGRVRLMNADVADCHA